MTTVEFSGHAGQDKVLRLTVPVEEGNRTYRVIVLFEPQLAGSETSRDAWPPGFIESTAGAWQGDFPEVAELDYEQRLPL